MNIFESMNYGFEKKYKLRESKEDKEKFLSFAGQDLFDRFELLKSKQIIKGQDADYTYWEKQPLQDLKNFIINTEKSQEEKNTRKQKVSSAYKARDEMTKNLQAGKDFEIIYQGEGWTVYYILTYEASASLGDGSTWCISGLYPKQEGPKKGRYFFNDYLQNKGIKGYYFLLPDTDFKNNKYAYTYKGTDLTLRDKWFWDNKDDPHTIENVDIPNDVLLSLPGISKKLIDDIQEEKDRMAEIQRIGVYTYNLLDDNGFIQKLNPKKVVVPNSVTQIGEDAFSHCTSLKEITIPNSVTEIGDDAFSYCASLKEITIPNSVTKIGNCAFSGCKSLQEITIPNGVTKIRNRAFSNCTSLQEITIPNSVKEIENYAFSNCTSLQEITIPNSVKEIENYAFDNCTSLKEITIPNSVTKIGDSVFSHCTSLKEITIPNSVTKIGDWVFYDCTSLKEITIPNSVTKIGDCAFYDCASLKEITIPNSIQEIGNYAFYDCASLKEITIKGKYNPKMFKNAGLEDTVILNWIDCGIKETWRDIKNKI